MLTTEEKNAKLFSDLKQELNKFAQKWKRPLMIRDLDAFSGRVAGAVGNYMLWRNVDFVERDLTELRATVQELKRALQKVTADNELMRELAYDLSGNYPQIYWLNRSAESEHNFCPRLLKQCERWLEEQGEDKDSLTGRFLNDLADAYREHTGAEVTYNKGKFAAFVQLALKFTGEAKSVDAVRDMIREHVYIVTEPYDFSRPPQEQGGFGEERAYHRKSLESQS